MPFYSTITKHPLHHSNIMICVHVFRYRNQSKYPEFSKKKNLIFFFNLMSQTNKKCYLHFNLNKYQHFIKHRKKLGLISFINKLNFRFKKIWLTITIGKGKNPDTHKHWIHLCAEPGHQKIKQETRTTLEFCLKFHVDIS